MNGDAMRERTKQRGQSIQRNEKILLNLRRTKGGRRKTQSNGVDEGKGEEDGDSLLDVFSLVPFSRGTLLRSLLHSISSFSSFHFSPFPSLLLLLALEEVQTNINITSLQTPSSLFHFPFKWKGEQKSRWRLRWGEVSSGRKTRTKPRL